MAVLVALGRTGSDAEAVGLIDQLVYGHQLVLRGPELECIGLSQRHGG